MEPKSEAEDWALAPPIYRGVYDTCYWWIRRLIPVGVRGVEHVPVEGPLVLAVNHLSYLDPLYVGMGFPRPVRWLAKKEVFNGAFWTWFFTKAGVTPVDRQAVGGNAAVLRAAVDTLQQGHVVGIYPEGTRAETADALRPAKTGVARLAFLSGAPILPVGLLSDHVWGKTMKGPSLGSRAYINFGAPIRLPHDPKLAEDKEASREATDRVMAEVRRLLDEAVAARDAGEPWAESRKVPRRART